MRVRTTVTQRHAAVLVWVPVLLAQLVVSRPAGSAAYLSLALGLVAAVTCVTAVLLSWPTPTWRSTLALLALAVVVLGSTLAWPGWEPAWLLVAMTAGVALRGRHGLVAIPACAVAAGVTMSQVSGVDDATVPQAFVVALAGTTAAALSRLVATAEALRRTREQLAVRAVGAERERVARDLHDVLGHTLSLMVVKAAAVRRLVPTDPAAAASHAEDIERIGRTAMSQVRDTIHDAQAPTLEEQLGAARDALSAADVVTSIRIESPPVGVADELLAWTLREGVTNVLRHACADHCWLTLAHAGGAHRLTVCDDGVGSRGRPLGQGGLEGLRVRLESAGGGMTTRGTPEGFTLTAWVPDEQGDA